MRSTSGIRDGTLTLQNNLLGVGARGSAYYARAEDGTVLSQRAPSGRRNYLYDGKGSVIALTDSTGAVTTSYTYDPYGHPPNLTTRGDQNPFGYRGAYSAGVESNGVLCGGPNQMGGGYYDAEDGRYTQPVSFLGLPSPDDYSDLKGAGKTLGKLFAPAAAAYCGVTSADSASRSNAPYKGTLKSLLKGPEFFGRDFYNCVKPPFAPLDRRQPMSLGRGCRSAE